MQDYLSQLINRTRQPALTVQPRPISRFESPRHPAVESFNPAGYSAPSEFPEESPEFFRLPELAAAEESGKPEVRSAPSGRFVTGMQADRPVQSNENSHPESRMANTLPGDFPAAESSMITQVSKPVFTHRLRREIDPVATGEQPIELSAQTVRTERTVPVSGTAATPTRSVMRQENAAEKATSFLNNALSEQPEHTEHITRRKQEPIEPGTGLEQNAKESTQPLIPPVRVENPGNKPTFPDSAPVTIAHRAGSISKVSAQTEPLSERRSDSIVRPHFSPASERAIFKQPFAEPATLQHTAGQPADTPAPTIQVTIGRIEVRATVAATSAAASARKAPARSSTMSLDDYLKQRNGRPR